jgi:hypothetical protein
MHPLAVRGATNRRRPLRFCWCATDAHLHTPLPVCHNACVPPLPMAMPTALGQPHTSSQASQQHAIRARRWPRHAPTAVLAAEHGPPQSLLSLLLVLPLLLLLTLPRKPLRRPLGPSAAAASARCPPAACPPAPAVGAAWRCSTHASQNNGQLHMLNVVQPSWQPGGELHGPADGRRRWALLLLLRGAAPKADSFFFFFSG